MTTPNYLTGASNTSTLGKSDDGVTFSAGPVVGGCDSVRYFPDDGFWLAAALSDGVVKKSTDGVTWTAVVTGFEGVGYCCHAVEKHGSLWIAVGSGPSNIAVRTSPDLITWTTRATVFDGATNGQGLNHIVSNGSVAVIFGYDVGFNVRTQYSGDGITWSNGINFGAFVTNPGALCYSKSTGKFVLGGGDSSQALLYTSTDGASWSSQNSGLEAKQIVSLNYANGVTCAGNSNGKVYTTRDFSSWTQRTGFTLPVNDIFQNRQSRELNDTHAFGVTGSNGKVALSDATGEVFSAEVDGGTSGHPIRGVGAVPNLAPVRRFILGGQSKALARSADSSAWIDNHGEPASMGDVYTIKYFPVPGVWIAGGIGFLAKSTDGKTWTTIALTNMVNVQDVCQHSGNWVVVGKGSSSTHVWTSPDLSVWTARSTAFDGGGNSVVRSVDSDDSTLVIVGEDSGGSRKIQTTTAVDVAFTTRLTDGTRVLWCVRKCGQTWICVGGNFGGSPLPVIYTSPNATTWTSRTPPTPNAIGGLAVRGGIALLPCGTDGCFTSPDGITWTARIGHGMSTVLFAWPTKNGFAVTDAAGNVATSETYGLTWSPKVYGGIGAPVITVADSSTTTPRISTLLRDRVFAGSHAVAKIDTTTVAVAAYKSLSTVLVDSVTGRAQIHTTLSVGYQLGDIALVNGSLMSVGDDGRLHKFSSAPAEITSVAVRAEHPWITPTGNFAVIHAGRGQIAIYNSSLTKLAQHPTGLSDVTYATADSTGNVYAFDGRGNAALLTVNLSTGALVFSSKFAVPNAQGVRAAFVDESAGELVIGCSVQSNIIVVDTTTLAVTASELNPGQKLVGLVIGDPERRGLFDTENTDVFPDNDLPLTAALIVATDVVFFASSKMSAVGLYRTLLEE